MLTPLDYVGFYGEPESSHESFFYSEPLYSRSARHDWMISPHRHKSIHQLFLVQKGGGEAMLDGKRHELRGPCVVSVPEGLIHSFRWCESSSGSVFTLSSSVASELWHSDYGSDFLTDGTVTMLDDDTAQQIAIIALQLEREDSAQNRFRSQMIHALLRQLFILIARTKQHAPQADSKLSKSEQKLNAFRQLIQQHGAARHNVGWYAGQIGITAAHLNHICLSATQSNALTLIHQYLLTEAKRFLAFADMSIATISDRLGFNEPAHFSRFFRKHEKLSPSAFRRRSRQQA